MQASSDETLRVDERPCRRKVYDGFMFFNELDLLEIRLRELYDVVDTFVVVEATVTFSGHPRELVFEANRQRFRYNGS